MCCLQSNHRVWSFPLKNTEILTFINVSFQIIRVSARILFWLSNFGISFWPKVFFIISKIWKSKFGNFMEIPKFNIFFCARNRGNFDDCKIAFISIQHGVWKRCENMGIWNIDKHVSCKPSWCRHWDLSLFLYLFLNTSWSSSRCWPHQHYRVLRRRYIRLRGGQTITH